MRMPNTLFAVLLAVLALYALYEAFRNWRGSPSFPRSAVGWVIVALAAVVQVFNLLGAYSVTMAILTTVALLVGAWLGRTPREAGPAI